MLVRHERDELLEKSVITEVLTLEGNSNLTFGRIPEGALGGLLEEILKSRNPRKNSLRNPRRNSLTNSQRTPRGITKEATEEILEGTSEGLRGRTPGGILRISKVEIPEGTPLGMPAETREINTERRPKALQAEILIEILSKTPGRGIPRIPRELPDTYLEELED